MLIGITGGIGAGKTSVCKQLELLRFPVYYSDERAKWLMENDLEVSNQLRLLFGNQTFLKDKLNRAFLADQIFKNPEKRKSMNAIVHPAVAKDFENWKNHQTSDFVFKESALLFETGNYKQSDVNVLITAPKEVRIARVMARDQVERSAVEARIDAQMSDEEKILLADYIIENRDGISIEKAVNQLLVYLNSKQNH